MKPTFLMCIYSSRKDKKELDDVFKSARANNFRMFLFNGFVYSVELVSMRKEKSYVSMDEAILFQMSELILQSK